MPDGTGTGSDAEAGGEVGVVTLLATLDDHRLDWAVTVLVLVSLCGLLLDIRSHIEGLNFEEEGFLTPEHAIIYGGFLAVILLFGGVVLARRAAGHGWARSVPDGYMLGALGLVLFAMGGPLDATWHSLFGAEANVEALVSPTHLLLATGGALFATSPMRASWHREPSTGWRRQFPVVVPATLVLTLFTAFSLYAHPAVVRPGSDARAVGHALLGIQFHAAMLTGIVLLLANRLRLAPGSLTVLVGSNGAAMTLLGQSTELLPAYVAAGVGADLLYAATVPSSERPRRLRLFAAALPAGLTALLFAGVAVADGLAWSVHLWAGAVFLGGPSACSSATSSSPPPAAPPDSSSQRVLDGPDGGGAVATGDDHRERPLRSASGLECHPGGPEPLEHPRQAAGVDLAGGEHGRERPAVAAERAAADRQQRFRAVGGHVSIALVVPRPHPRTHGDAGPAVGLVVVVELLGVAAERRRDGLPVAVRTALALDEEPGGRGEVHDAGPERGLEEGVLADGLPGVGGDGHARSVGGGRQATVGSARPCRPQHAAGTRARSTAVGVPGRVAVHRPGCTAAHRPGCTAASRRGCTADHHPGCTAARCRSP